VYAGVAEGRDDRDDKARRGLASTPTGPGVRGARGGMGERTRARCTSPTGLSVLEMLKHSVPR
jgi:hypothetical protein